MSDNQRTISDVITPLANAIRTKALIEGSLTFDQMTSAVSNRTFGIVDLANESFNAGTVEIWYSSYDGVYTSNFDPNDFCFSRIPLTNLTIEIGELDNRLDVGNNGVGRLPDHAFLNATITGNLLLIAVDSFNLGSNSFAGISVGGLATIPVSDIDNVGGLNNASFNVVRFNELSNIVSAPAFSASYAWFDKPVNFYNSALSGATIQNYIFTSTTMRSTLDAANIGLAQSPNIYVPRSMVSSYKSATNWSFFASRISAIEDNVTVNAMVNGGTS